MVNVKSFANSKIKTGLKRGLEFLLNAKMFCKLQKLDLRRSQISDEAVEKFLEAFGHKEGHNVSVLERLDLSGCNVSRASVLEFHEINRRKATDLIVFKALDLSSETKKNGCCFKRCC